MTNNLRKIKKDLCSFAKRCQDFRYTDSALIFTDGNSKYFK